MDKLAAAQLCVDLYKDIDGYAISKQAQEKLGYFYVAHVYGEVEFESFYDILDFTHPKEGDIFYDLGSGTGKAVVLAGLCFPFTKSIGVEKLEDLYEASVRVANKLQRPSIEFVKKDFNDFDFRNGDVIFMNSYYFNYEMNNPGFIDKMFQLKKGTRIITVHTPFVADFLRIKSLGLFDFSWSKAEVFLSEKIV